MSHGVTTSIRLEPKLRGQLDSVCHVLHRGKNWVIAKALEEYLSRFNGNNLAEEARRQSLLAAKADKKIETDMWEDNTDTSGWI